MATTAQININVNASQADKTVQQLNKDLTAAGGSAASLRTELRQVTQELQGLEPSSKRFQELSQRAGELRDRIADTSAVISATAGNVTENFGRALGNSIQIGVAGFQALQSAQVLFGVENEDLQKTLVQMSALLNLSQAIETFGGLGDKLTEIKAGFTPLLQQLGLMATSQTAVATATGAADVALVGEAVAADGAAVSTGFFATALNALPLVAIVTALGLLVAGLISYASASGDVEKQEKKRAATLKAQREEQIKSKKTIADESGEFLLLIERLKQTNAKSDERKKLIKDINSTYGTTFTNLQNEIAFQASLNLAVQDYITFQTNKYNLEKNQEAFNAVLAKEGDAIKANKGAKEAYDKANKKVNENTQGAHYLELENLAKLKLAYEKTQAEVDRLAKRKQYLAQSDSKLLASQDDLTNGGKRYEVQTINNTNAINDNTDALDKQKNLLADVKKEFDRRTSAERELQALQAAQTVISMSTKTIFENEVDVEDKKNKDVEIGYKKLLSSRITYNEEYHKKKFELEDQYNEKSRILIEQATEREIELLDEQFVKGEIGKKKYEEKRLEIQKNGSKNLLVEELAILEIVKKNNDKELEQYTELWNNKEETAIQATELTNSEIEKLVFDFNQKMLIDEVENSTKTEEEKNAAIIKIRTDGLEEQKKLIKNNGDEQIDLIKVQKEKELTNFELTENEREQITAKYDKQILETEQNTQSQIQEAINGTIQVQETQLSKLQNSLTQIDNYLEVIQQAFSEFETTFTMFQEQQTEIRTQAIQDGLNKQQAALESSLAEGLISEEQYRNALTQLEQQQQQDETALRYKTFRQNKALSIAGATIDGARAVLSTFANTPGELIIKSIAAALAGVFAATQIALIGRQEFRAAVGGIVPGTGSGEIDTVPSRLAPGEAVINSKSTDAFLPLLSMINEAAGGKSLMPDIPAVNQGQRFEPVYQSQSQTQPIRAYVVESDISQSQRRVNRIINSATF
jgi:hypothetical protein